MCPPEDVGGIAGYEDFLAAISDPTHPEHENMVQWCGRPFDAAHFDLEDTNRRLMEIQL